MSVRRQGQNQRAVLIAPIELLRKCSGLFPKLMPASAHVPELLAPAGNRECARAAVANGADAIYFGLPRFNARLRADNFTEEELPELMEFLHGHGVRGFVAINTLIFTGELAGARKQQCACSKPRAWTPSSCRTSAWRGWRGRSRRSWNSTPAPR